MKEPILKIDLTPEQKERLKKEAGKEVEALKLNLQELEGRINPGVSLN
jgi:hypothetical protein